MKRMKMVFKKQEDGSHIVEMEGTKEKMYLSRKRSLEVGEYLLKEGD